MKNIYLVGFMGSGKSTIGKLLAKETGYRFVDIDKEIEKNEDMSIKEIFSSKGEKYFRDLEKKMIKNFVEKKGFIVSTGGGLGADKENMELMKKKGVVIWLDVSLDTVLKRCGEDENRPLLKKSRNDLEKLFEKRKQIYASADIHIDVNNKTPDQIVKEILRKIR
ncbi:shikimate kinase [Persephonella sp.]